MLLLAAAVLFGKLAEKANIPTIVGNIIGGLVLGPVMIGLLNLLWHLTDLDVLEAIAFDIRPSTIEGPLALLIDLSIMMLMFSSGLETKLKEFISSFRTGLPTAFLGVLFPFVLGFLGTYLYMGDAMTALYVGGALSITAVALSVAALVNIDAINSRFGLTIINAAIVDDIIGIIVLAVLLSVSRTGQAPTLGTIVAILLLAVIYVIFTLFVMPFLMKLLYKGLHDIRTTEAVGITILVAGCFSILAYVMGLHIMIGAFLGGMAAGSVLKHSTKMALNRWSFGFFAPLFFAYIGYSVTFSGAVFSLFVPLIMVMGMVGKVLGAGLGAKISGLNWAESFLVGVGMNGRAAVDLILASVALSSGIIERDLFSAIVLNAAVMALITPVLLKMLVSFFKRNGRIAI